MISENLGELERTLDNKQNPCRICKYKDEPINGNVCCWCIKNNETDQYYLWQWVF